MLEKLILGVEIGGTKLQLAAGNQAGDILKSHQGTVEREAGGKGRTWRGTLLPGRRLRP